MSDEITSERDREALNQFCFWVEEFGKTVDKLAKSVPDPQQLERLVTAVEKLARMQEER